MIRSRRCGVLSSDGFGLFPVRVFSPAGRHQLIFDLQGSGQRVRRTVEIAPDTLKRLALPLR